MKTQTIKGKTLLKPDPITYYMLVFRIGFHWHSASTMHLTLNAAWGDMESYKNCKEYRVVEIKLPGKTFKDI